MKALKLFSIFILFSHVIHGQCFISGYSQLGQLSKTTGNPVLDSKFNASKIDLESVFGVTVDLYVYNDGNSPNAFAMNSNSYAFNGMVAFGQNMLLSQLWNISKGEYAVAGVLAHEFAHVLQIKKGCDLPNPEKELQADYLAGYYFGRRAFLSTGLYNFASELYSIGDYNFWSEDHHGTPDQRVNAMLAGYESAYLTIDEAYEEGIEYVTSYEEEDYCSLCNGDGLLENWSVCSGCYGNKVVACYSCMGNGGYFQYGYNQYGIYGQWWYVCNVCGGTKINTCSFCFGTGQILSTQVCSLCNGSGH